MKLEIQLIQIDYKSTAQCSSCLLFKIESKSNQFDLKLNVNKFKDYLPKRFVFLFNWSNIL